MAEEHAVTRDAQITLREVTRENLREICKLSVAPDQVLLVANNAFSIAEASFYDDAWYRAIYADETPVGFVMLQEDRVKPEYYLWRYMIDQRFQRLGFGRRAITLIVDRVRTHPGATELLLLYVPGDRSPAPFYASLGFEETGVESEGERGMRLRLAPTPGAD